MNSPERSPSDLREESVHGAEDVEDLYVAGVNEAINETHNTEFPGSGERGGGAYRYNFEENTEDLSESNEADNEAQTEDTEDRNDFISRARDFLNGEGSRHRREGFDEEGEGEPESDEQESNEEESADRWEDNPDLTIVEMLNAENANDQSKKAFEQSGLSYQEWLNKGGYQGFIIRRRHIDELENAEGNGNSDEEPDPITTGPVNIPTPAETQDEPDETDPSVEDPNETDNQDLEEGESNEQDSRVRSWITRIRNALPAGAVAGVSRLGELLNNRFRSAESEEGNERENRRKNWHRAVGALLLLGVLGAGIGMGELNDDDTDAQAEPVEDPVEDKEIEEYMEPFVDTVGEGEGITHTIRDYIAEKYQVSLSADQYKDIWESLNTDMTLDEIKEGFSGSEDMDVYGGAGFPEPGMQTEMSPELQRAVDSILEQKGWTG